MEDTDNLSLLNYQKTAVLVIDVQNAYCSPEGYFGRKGAQLTDITSKLTRINSFLEEIRKTNTKIIFTRMIEDVDFMPLNAQLKQKSAGDHIKISSPESFDFEYTITKKDSDEEIVKYSYDAFTNPTLVTKLAGVENLVIIGVTADACVDTTIRSAYSRGYNIVTSEDLVATLDSRKDNEVAAIKMWKLIFAFVVDQNQLTKWLTKGNAK